MKTGMHFLAWIDGVNAKGVSVMNAPALLRWNTDKHYLLDLKERGVNVAPTYIFDVGKEMVLPPSDTGWVIKPCVGASSAMVERFGIHDGAHAVAYAKQLLSHSGVVLQPFIPEVMSGEVSYMFFNRAFSHAVKRTPHHDDYRNQPDYQGHEELYVPTDEEVSAARQVLDAVDEDLLYARVDTVKREGVLTVMELELVEPYLFFEFDSAAPDKFIQAVHNLVE